MAVIALGLLIAVLSTVMVIAAGMMMGRVHDEMTTNKSSKEETNEFHERGESYDSTSRDSGH